MRGVRWRRLSVLSVVLAVRGSDFQSFQAIASDSDIADIRASGGPVPPDGKAQR